MYEIRHYLTADGRDPFADWLARMTDIRAKANILGRLDRMAAGNLGDWKPVRQGVSELRIDHGAGYRVYFSQTGKTLMLLLAGGDKKSQKADMARAHDFLTDWKQRSRP